MTEAPSDDPYCASHGQRFDPAVGCPACLEPDVEMVTVPRALLREIRTDLLLAYTGRDGVVEPEVAQMLRKDYAALLAHVPYRFDPEDSL